MYFNASERIASRTHYLRSQIQSVDTFLAGSRVRRFELRQLQEKTGLYNDIAPILEEFVKERVLRKEVFHVCPEDFSQLERINQLEGRCISCDKIYAYEDCPTKLIYERLRDPEHPRLDQGFESSAAKTVVISYQSPSKFDLVNLIIGIVSVLFGFIQIIPIIFPSHFYKNDQVIIATIQPTIPPSESKAPPTPLFASSEEVIEPTRAPTNSIEMKSEVTPEQTREADSQSLVR